MIAILLENFTAHGVNMAGVAIGIKERLEHGTQRKIARRLGLSEGYVSEVISGAAQPRTERGRKTQRRVQVIVARAVGMKVDDVFPAEAA